MNDARIQDLTKEELAVADIFDAAIRQAYSQGEIKHLLKNAPIEFLQPHIYSMVKDERVDIKDIPPVFLEDYDIAVLYAKQDVANMVTLPPSYANDAEFIGEVAHHDGEILAYASEAVKDIQEIVDVALKNNLKAFKDVPEKYKTKENCIFALTGYFPHYAFNWQYVPEPLCKDEGFIKEVCVFCPKIYQYLAPEIKDKYDITEMFLTRDGSNLKYASEINKNNPALVTPVLEKNPVYLRFAGNTLKNDPDFILPVLKKEPYELQVCGDAIKSNRDIAKYICNVKNSQPPIAFFNEEIKSDMTISMMAVLRMPESMNYISKTLSSSASFVSLYIEQDAFDPIALHYIANDLKNDAVVMKKAYDRDAESLNYVGNTLKHDPEFLTHIFSSQRDGQWVSKNVLLSNLKSLRIGLHDEDVLLHFCDHAGFNINEEKSEICRAIASPEFVNLLIQQSDAYAYLKATSLMYTLQENLETKEINAKKIKI